MIKSQAIMNQINKVLSDLDLSETEIITYLDLLKLGKTTSTVLAKRSRLNRSTARYTLDQLVKRRLAVVEQKNHVFYFTAEHPQKIIYLIDEKREELDEKERRAQNIIRNLEKIMNPHTVLPKVQFFEGKEGLTRLYDAILELEKPIDSFEDKGEMEKFIPEYVKKFIATRKDKQITNRVICPGSNTLNKKQASELRETRFIQEKQFPFTGDIKICGDLVSIFSFSDQSPVGIGIKHQEIADNFRILFELSWKHLSRQ